LVFTTVLYSEAEEKQNMLFVTDCKYGLTETDVKHILKMKKGKKFGERKENRSE
jgi:hypothetical protein